MKIKQLFLIVLTAVILSVGCKTVPQIVGKTTKQEDAAKQTILHTENIILKNDKDKITQISILASGTDYALGKVTNKEPAVDTAVDINKRVISLSGKPDFNAEKEMWKIVDELTSNLEKEKLLGKKDLSKKDDEINKLQKLTRLLIDQKDDDIKKYMKIATAAATESDGRQYELNKMNSWFGIGAIIYGVKRLFLNITWFLVIGAVLFLILRLGAAGNPIIGSIFSICERIGSWGINIISVLVPKSLSIAGHVTQEAFNKSSFLLKKIVDQIQYIKSIENVTGKDITLKELLTQLDKSMDVVEKEFVAKIKKELGY